MKSHTNQKIIARLWPLGDMGVGGDVDWLIGSPDVPELNFSPVSFDKEKFTNNILDDKPYGQKGKSESDEQGTWEDGGTGGDLEAKPDVKDGEGPDSQGNQENLKKLPDEQKYMRALDELSTLENADPKPTLSMVKAKVKEVDNKYGIDQIKVSDKKDKAEIFVKHAKQDNSDHKLKISLMTESERTALVDKAKDDLSASFKKDVDKEGRMTKDKTNDILTDWKKHHKVISKAWLEEKGGHWEVVMDLGDKKEKLKGPLMPAEEEIKKPTTPKEHDQQVKDGLAYLEQETKAEDKDNNKAITLKEAEAAASKTKKKFPVFTSIIPRVENGKWVYDWTGSKGKKETGIQEEITGHGQLIVGLHPVNQGTGRHSHHVPANELAQTLGHFYGDIGNILPNNSVYGNLKGELGSRKNTIHTKYSKGKDLPAISLDSKTHIGKERGVHSKNLQETILQDLQTLGIHQESKPIVVKNKDGIIYGKYESSHWQTLIKEIYNQEKSKLGDDEKLEIQSELDEEVIVIKSFDPKSSKQIANDIDSIIQKKTKNTSQEKNKVVNLINNTAEETYLNALNSGISAVETALKISTTDGDTNEHKSAIEQLRTLSQSIWHKIILAKFR